MFGFWSWRPRPDGAGPQPWCNAQVPTGWRGWGQLKQFKEIGSQTYLRADVERQRLFGALANPITLKTPMVSARNGNKRRQWAAMIYPGEGKKGQPKAGDYMLAAERVRAEAAASPHQGTAFDLARADKWEGQARTKQLPSTRTEIGAGGELIDREDRWDELGVVNTVADPDYVTASASRERLELASEAGSLSFALDAAETIQARDSLEKMLVHQMAVLHRGMMRAAIRMNEEISRMNEHLYHLDEGKREAANVRACRLAGAISRLSATYQQGLLTH